MGIPVGGSRGLSTRRRITSRLAPVLLVAILASYRLARSGRPLARWSSTVLTGDDDALQARRSNHRNQSSRSGGGRHLPSQRRGKRQRRADWDPRLTGSAAVTAASASADTVVCTTARGETVALPRGVPGFLIIGAQKCGTTALSAILSRHPHIGSTVKREPHFFDRGRPRADAPPLGAVAACTQRLRYLKENFHVPRYLQQRRRVAATEKATFLLHEKTPSYLRYPGAARRVWEILGRDVRLLVLLRDPVARAYSQYRMEKQRRVAVAASFDDLVAAEVEALRNASLTRVPPLAAFDPTFDLQWAAPDGFAARRRIVVESMTPRQYKMKGMKDSVLYTGMYATQLDEWLQYYELDRNLLVLRSEELHQNSSDVLKRVQSFLGLSPMDFDEDIIASQYNPLKGGRGWREGASIQVDKASNRTIAYLKRFYRPYNEELADLLGEEWRGVWE